MGSFRESGEARVALPDGPQAVEAVLEHVYTGRLPAVDPLLVLPLARRMPIFACVATACKAIPDSCAAAAAVRVLLPLLEDPAAKAAWARLKSHIRNGAVLLDDVLRELASAAQAPRPPVTLGAPAMDTFDDDNDNGDGGQGHSHDQGHAHDGDAEGEEGGGATDTNFDDHGGEDFFGHQACSDAAHSAHAGAQEPPGGRGTPR